MAQSEEDFKTIKLDLESIIVLDLERLSNDPTWKQISIGYDLDIKDLPPEVFNQMLTDYLGYYLDQIRLFKYCKSSNGPSEARIKNIQIL